MQASINNRIIAQAKISFLAALLSASALAPGVAFAQSAPSGSQEAEQGSNDIVVTAQKRAESVQAVPIAITAVSGQGLIRQGVSSVLDLSVTSPGLQITNSGTWGGSAQIFMRGVGSTNVTLGGDSAIAVHMDGVYIARANALGAALYDIDRVEVLRGPQGTLYGRNATAGAINVITKRPEFGSVAGSASVEFGNYEALTATGVLNVPLSDTLAFRAAFQSARHDGYLKSVTNAPVTARGNDRNDQDDQSARMQLYWKPTDRFSLLLRGDYTHRGGAGAGDVAYPLETGDPYEALARQNVSLDNSFWNVGLEAAYDLSFAELTYLGNRYGGDVDVVGENMLSNNHRIQYVLQSHKNWSHELRLSGESGIVKWVIGGYRFTEDYDLDFKIGLASGNFLSFELDPIKAGTWAGFAQTTVSISDALRVTGGIRYTEDTKMRRGATFIRTPAGALVSQTGNNDADARWQKVNWKVGLDYDVGAHNLLYAQVATGYKAGGYNDGGTIYGPENITAYEIGSKNHFFDRRLRFNVAAFYNDYRDLQVSAIEALGSTGATALLTRNAGKTEIYGIELESQFRPSSADTFDLMVAWTHARYTDFVLPLGDAFSNNGINASVERCYSADETSPAPRRADFSGCRLARTPDWAVSLGYAHDFALANGATVTARIQSRYESEKELEYHGFVTNKQDSFTKTDLSVTYSAPRDRWSVMAYVRNLENEAVMTNANSDATTGNSTIGTAYYAPPRLYGVRFSVNFD